MRLAAVDIGTNTVRLLVVERVGGELVELLRVATVVGLGVGVDSTGHLGAEAMGRALAALGEFAEPVSSAHACRVIATAASRDADNRETFFDAVQAVLGHRPELIAGAEEAGLAFAGATSGRLDGPFLVVDIGGGSTEFVLGERAVSHAVSTQIGSVRITERASLVPPASPTVLAHARSIVADLFVAAPTADFATGIGVAGTYTSLSALSQGLTVYDRSAVHGSVLTPALLREQVDRLAGLTVDEIAALPTMEPRRAPFMLGGAVVAEEVSRSMGIDRLIVSERDLLDGVVAELLPQ